MAGELTATPTAQSKSPSPSPRHRRSDPFNNIPQLRPSSSHSSGGSGEGEGETEEDQKPDSLFQRIIVSPLLFTSFLISLFIVERRDRAWRVSQNQSSNSSFWSRLSLWSWVDPEPYQDPSDTTWQKDDAGQSGAQNPATDGNPQKPVKKRGWFTRKKHRKMAKMRIEDAWDAMGTVEMFIVGAGVIVVGGTVWGVRRLYEWAG